MADKVTLDNLLCYPGVDSAGRFQATGAILLHTDIDSDRDYAVLRAMCKEYEHTYGVKVWAGSGVVVCTDLEILK